MDAFVDPTEEDFGNLFQKLSPDEFEKLEEILGSNIEATVDPKIEQTFSEQTLTFQGQNYNMEDNINIENIRRHLQQSPDYSFQEFLPSQQIRQHQPHVKDELQWRITMHGQSNLQQHEQWLNQPISIKREVDENSNEYYNSSSYNSDVAVDISGDEAASTSISCKKRKTSSPSMSSSSSQLSGVDDERFPKVSMLRQPETVKLKSTDYLNSCSKAIFFLICYCSTV